MSTERPPVTGFEFTDPTNPGQLLALLVDGETPTVEHPPCEALADVSVDLDAWFCPTCGARGRVAGSWVYTLWQARSASDGG